MTRRRLAIAAGAVRRYRHDDAAISSMRLLADGIFRADKRFHAAKNDESSAHVARARHAPAFRHDAFHAAQRLAST